MSGLTFRTLGPLQAWFDGYSLELGTRKQRALLTLLVANYGRAVPADRIIAALWGPAAVERRREDVWVYISRLRKGLSPAGDALSRNGAGYRLDVEGDVIDAYRFEALVAKGRELLATDLRAASRTLGDALAIWSGEAFGEFAGEDFVAAEGARLEESRLAAIEMKLEAGLALGDDGALTAEIEGLVKAHPLRPRLTAGLMTALYRQQRQADALLAYRHFAERMAEMGLRPPAHLRDLEERILVDSPALDSTPRRAQAKHASVGPPCRARA